jgi:NADH:ubiquinone oxidoreductase subunit 4 (subunit M)
VLGALYMLWLAERMLFGAVKARISLSPISNGRERAILVALVAAIFWLGLFPPSRSARPSSPRGTTSSW